MVGCLGVLMVDEHMATALTGAHDHVHDAAAAQHHCAA
jgi:hypothetical protein